MNKQERKALTESIKKCNGCKNLNFYNGTCKKTDVGINTFTDATGYITFITPNMCEKNKEKKQ